MAVKEADNHEGNQQQVKKVFSADIVMQKKTFDGLVVLIPCIHHRFRLLLQDLDFVKEVKDTLIEKISEEATLKNWSEVSREQVTATGLKMILDEYMGTAHDDIQTPYGREEQMDEKRRLIGNEIMCLHHEYIFREVSSRFEKSLKKKYLY